MVSNLNLFQDLQTEGGVGQNDVGTVRKGTVLASEQRNLLISDFKSFSMELKASWRKSGFKGSRFFLLKLQGIFSPQASKYLFSSSFKKIFLFKLQEMLHSLKIISDFLIFIVAGRMPRVVEEC